MKRCVIVGGAEIGNYERIRERLEAEDTLIFCDCGLRHVAGLRRKPDLIVGDFDSFQQPETDIETIVLPREKADTDTMYAVKEGLRRGFDSFLLIGVIGARFDHSFGNISILLYLDSLEREARMLDDYSEMEIVSRRGAVIDDSWSYFSLLNISATARGIRISGAKYPLNGAEITPEFQYGISNEVLPGQKARVTLTEGRLLLVKVF